MAATKSIQGVSTLSASYFVAKSGKGCSNFCLRLPDGSLLTCVALDSERFPSAQYAHEHIKPGLMVSVTGSCKDGEDVFFVNNIFVGDIKDHPPSKGNAAATHVKPRIGHSKTYKKAMEKEGIVWADCGDFHGFQMQEDCVKEDGKWVWKLWLCQRELGDSYVYAKFKEFRAQWNDADPSKILAGGVIRRRGMEKAVQVKVGYHEAYKAFMADLLREARFE